MEKFKPSLLSLQMQCRSLQVLPEAMLQVCRGGHIQTHRTLNKCLFLFLFLLLTVLLFFLKSRPDARCAVVSAQVT